MQHQSPARLQANASGLSPAAAALLHHHHHDHQQTLYRPTHPIGQEFLQYHLNSHQNYSSHQNESMNCSQQPVNNLSQNQQMQVVNLAPRAVAPDVTHHMASAGRSALDCNSNGILRLDNTGMMGSSNSSSIKEKATLVISAINELRSSGSNMNDGSINYNNFNEIYCSNLVTDDGSKYNIVSKPPTNSTADFHSNRLIPTTSRVPVEVKRTRVDRRKDANLCRRSYNCPTCGKGFTEKFNMKRHTQIHSSSRPKYVCNECSKSFSWKDNFIRHRKAAHSVS